MKFNWAREKENVKLETVILLHFCTFDDKEEILDSFKIYEYTKLELNLTFMW